MWIYEVESDGVSRFFADSGEADFAFKEASGSDRTVRKAPIPVPTSAQAFADFMERMQSGQPRPIRRKE